MTASCYPAPHECHRFAAIFPLMKEHELGELIDDIRRNGQLEPIVRWHGEIVDGRHREAACRALGIAPRYVEWGGGAEIQLLDFVVSQNVRRRHLSESQRALAVAEAARLREPAARRRKLLAPAAESVGISPRLGQYAQTLLDRGVPELVEMVRAGDVSLVHVADKIARQTKAKQRRLVASGAHAVVAEARRLGWSGHKEAPPTKPPRAAPKKGFMAFGRYWGDYDRAAIAAELALLQALVARLPEEGPASFHLMPGEFEALKREARK